MRPFLLFSFLCTAAPTLAQQPDMLTPRRVTVAVSAIADSLTLPGIDSSRASFIDQVQGILIERNRSFPFLPIQEQLRQVAGVQATPFSGAPGAQVVVRIRGAASFANHARPLYVVDGVPVFQRTFWSGVSDAVYLDALPEIQELDTNPLLHIPTEDIEQVEVLKGAFETAQYGSQGINGVIRITTRRGRTGAPRVQYNGYGGLQQARYRYELLDARQYATLANEAARNDGESPRFSSAELAALGRGTDWQAELLRTAVVQGHHLSLAGGTATTHYYTGVDYLGQQGIMLNSNLRRYAVRANVDQQLGQRLHVAARGSLSETQRRVPSYYALQNALYERPTRTVQDTVYQRRDWITPVQEASEWYQTPRQQRLLTQLDARYRLATGLTLEVLGGLERATQRSQSYKSVTISAAGKYADLTSTYKQWLVNPALRYARDFAGGRHAVAASVEAIGQQQTTKDELLSYIPGAPVEGREYSYSLIESLFYRLTGGYTFAGRYQLQGSLRHDVLSIMPAADRKLWLPGAQATWHTDKEAFLKDNATISKLNVWVGWGYTMGASNVGGTRYTLFKPGFPIVANNRLLPLRERSRQLDAGFTLGLWQDQLNVTIQSYTRHTIDDQEEYLKLPGTLHNKGVELSLAGRWRLGAVQGSTALAGAINRNRYQAELSATPTSYEQAVYNQPLSTFYGLRYLGIDAAGLPRFAEGPTNGRPIEDQQPLGSGLPRQLLTLTQQLQYKRFALDVQADAMWGYQVQNIQLGVLDAPSGIDNATTRVLNRWTPTNTATDVPRASQQFRAVSFSNYILQSGNHVRLTAVSLSYPVWKREAHSASVWVGGQNLLVVTRYRGYDPNVSSFGSDNKQAGIDQGAYPTARTFLLGVRATL
ncbi:SusC/RagA family TonB-linked outer membrane protein [Hymenobacter aerilatus]|uniref:SusC/RagA family TonB-linked outer membrane protein n=1 Tax=Hymenobacter aerilatus TaxID=2932251 RepID=A0A8T9SSZ7_9BACT|nr:SusC/RagA family TonB-linked outer membrane protein [Hymenobacter aerilatus]UOR04925.1 SusC/RagA family TonB-linked outer membrane protein [Hymenobacter aerilatus]